MNLIKIELEKLPIITIDNLTVETVENMFVEKPYGVVFVIDDEERFAGYFSVDYWNPARDISASYVKPIYLYDKLDIELDHPPKMPLYPILDEENHIMCAYYDMDLEAQVVEQMERILSIREFNYNMGHFTKVAGFSGKKVAVYTSPERLIESLCFAELFCGRESNVFMSGVYVFSGYDQENRSSYSNYQTDVREVTSLDHLWNQGIEVLFINHPAYTRSKRIRKLNEHLICLDIQQSLISIENKFMSAYAIHTYKKLFQDMGVYFYSAMVPVVEDFGVINMGAEAESAVEFLKRNPYISDGEAFYETMQEHVSVVRKHKQLRFYGNAESKDYNFTKMCRAVWNQPTDYAHTIYLVGANIVTGLFVPDRETLGSMVQQYFNQNDEVVRVVALGMPDSVQRDFFFKAVLAQKLQAGDVVVLFDDRNHLMNADMSLTELYKNMLLEHGHQIFYEAPANANGLVMQAIAEAMYRFLHGDATGFSEKKSWSAAEVPQTAKEIPTISLSFATTMDMELPEEVSLSGAISVDNCNKIFWKESMGATSYIIFRREKGQRFRRIGVSNTVSYVDKQVLANHTYLYTVRAVNAAGMSENYNREGVVVTTVGMELPDRVKMDRIATIEGAVIISWNPVTSAKSYSVYRKEGDNPWKKIAKVGRTKFADKTVEKDVRYSYTVRAVNENGSSLHFDKDGLSIVAK